MRYSSADERRPHLLNGWGLSLIGLLIVAVLGLVFPRQSVLTLPAGGKADGVSIAYAELLLKSKPDDQSLRLQLIEQLLAVGNLDRAELHLANMPPGELDAQADFLRLEAKLQRAFAHPEGLTESQRLEYAQLLASLLQRGLSAARLQQAAELALAFAEPQLAAKAYARLAEVDPNNAPYWLELGARWSRAAGDSAQAAALYQRLADLSASAEERDRYQLAVFTSLVAAGEGTQALRWLDQRLMQLPPSAVAIELLQAGIREARGHSDNARALAYLERWQALLPNQELWLEQAFALTLAMGNLDSAWTLGLELHVLRPDDQVLLRQLAQLAEWSGQPAQGLPFWVRLARENRATADYEHAWRLSGQLFDYPQMSVLLVELAELRALNLEELKALVFALESQAKPEQARDWLALYVQRRPGERDAWRQLAQINRNMQHLQAEAEVWAAMARQHKLSEQERIEWAGLYWMIFEPQQGWDVLAQIPVEKARSVAFLTLRSDLAWALELDAEVLRSLEQLQRVQERLSGDQTERLLTLYLRLDPAKALQLAIQSWHQHQALNRLALALQLATQLRDWPTLRSLLDEAKPYAQQLQGEPVYWQAQIEQATQRGDDAQVDKFLARLLALFPEQSWVIERYLWTQIARQRSADLALHLQQWRPLARQEDSLWLAFASAYSVLGDVPESLRWYRLYTQAHPNDLLTLAAYADTLELAGQADSAWRLRRYLLAKWQLPPPDSADLQPQRFATYLRLLANLAGAQRSRLLSQQALQQASPVTSQPLLEAWFERWLAQLESLNQSGAIEPWLAWAKAHGIKIDSNARLQSALRGMRRQELQQWLAKDELPPDSRAEIWLRLGLEQRALKESLQALKEHRAPAQLQTLRNQAQGVIERQPQGVQLARNDRDFGGLRQLGEQFLLASAVGDSYLAVGLDNARFSGSNLLDEQLLGREQGLRLSLKNPLADGEWTLLLEASQNAVQNRQGLGLERSWQLSGRDALALGLEWQVQSDESGLMRALGARDSLYAQGQHALSVRDQLSWRLARNSFSTAEGAALGDGWAASFELSHSLLAREPQWLLRSGVTWQENKTVSELPSELFISQGGALFDAVLDSNPSDDIDDGFSGATPSDFISSRFGEVYVGSSWQRGTPGALNRAWPQFTYRLDAKAGWQVPDNKLAYAFEAGLGVEVMGDDELALLGGYSSAPVGGEGQAGGQLRLAYSLRFGR
ncbi:MAG: tetratricopeptide repeat protein [Pseudomonas sp.]|nr:tetratricopeptide repeat protein [Pseudomonas sp.]